MDCTLLIEALTGRLGGSDSHVDGKISGLQVLESAGMNSVFTTIAWLEKQAVARLAATILSTAQYLLVPPSLTIHLHRHAQL